MRLVDLVNQLQRKGSEGANVIRHPFAAAYRQVRRRFQTWFEGATLPGSETASASANQEDQAAPQSRSSAAIATPASAASIDSRSRDAVREPAIARAQTATLPAADDFFAADVALLPPPGPQYPPLLPQGEILQGGWWGRYLLRGCLSDRGWMRLYEGVQENSQEAVWIYEYLLTADAFSQREAEQRLQAFRYLINQNLRLGSGADFRLLKLKDVIPDLDSQRRCYLIAQPIAGADTLAAYLETQGAMPPRQVRQVLRQVLQSLRYLHTTYRVRWLDDKSDRGLVHGNLRPDSLWLRWDPQAISGRDRQFFVYLSRFALWEHICWPPNDHYRLSQIATDPQDLGSVTQDLTDLGQLAFDLLTGQTPHPETGKVRNPLQAEDWPQDPEALALRPFIWRLMGSGPQPRFKSADLALSVLQNAQAIVPVAAPAVVAEPEAPAADPIWRSGWLWLGLGTAAALSLLLFFWLRQRSLGEPILPLADSCTENCLIAKVPLPRGSSTFTYGIEPDSSWTSAFFHYLAEPGTAMNVADAKQTRSPLHTLLADRANVSLVQPSFAGVTADEPMRLVRSGQLDFALMQAIGDELGADMTAEVVAYDAIVPVVVFSDGYRSQSVPKMLGGEITLQALGDLFAGRVTELKGKPVRLYFPSDDATVERFQAQLQDLGELSAPEAENTFTQLRQADQSRARAKALAKQPDNLYERMLVDFEAQADDPEFIGIGFDRLSRVVGQCSVYPLAIQYRGKTNAVVIGANGDPVTPNADLCGDKGSYWANSVILSRGSYPLGYGLSVVHPACEASDPICNQGAAFAAMLKTDEGQYLLSQVGLVPMQPISHLHSVLWASQ